MRVTKMLRESVTLGWESPSYDGGLPITGYIIERRDATRGGWTTVGTSDPHAHSFTVPKLMEGSEYMFRVMAENVAGAGVPMESSHAVEIKSPYGELILYSLPANTKQCWFNVGSASQTMVQQ